MIKHYEASIESDGMDLKDIVLSLFSSITPEDCMHWIEHCIIHVNDYYVILSQ